MSYAKQIRSLAIIIVFCVSTIDARADLIPGLFNTGLQTEGSGETNYFIISPSRTARVVAAFTCPCGSSWISNSAASKWISTMSATTDLPGNYTYRLIFDLSLLDTNSAVITGRWATDDNGALFLNGVDTGIRRTNGWESFSQTFTINRGFFSGQNTLDFVVTNAGDQLNPTGLRVELVGTANRLPAPPMLINPQHQSDGFFTATLTGETNRTYSIEATADWSQWTLITTLAPTNGSSDWADTNAPSFRFRFYRVRLFP